MTIKELKKELEQYNDNDIVVCEVDDLTGTDILEDLYDFTIYEIAGVETKDGLYSEIRINLLDHNSK